jgi:hypothetical protein
MSLQDAEAKLPGFRIIPAQINYLPALQAVFLSKGSEGYLLEAVSGRLALIEHYISVPQDQAFSKQNYVNRLNAKYGPVTQAGNGLEMNWFWDAEGRHITSTFGKDQGCADTERGVPLRTQPFGSNDPLQWWVVHSMAVYSVPTVDTPGCHLRLMVAFPNNGQHDAPPAGAILATDSVLVDPSMFFPPVKAEIDKARAAKDAQQKATQQRSGPPM